jgi:hypothetical protein
MSRILYAWELGGSLGHLTRIYPILLALEQRGHVISAAVRGQNNLTQLWPKLRGTIHRAPHKAQPSAREIHPVKYYVDVLHNCGWGEATELRAQIADWQKLFHEVQPHFVLHDHSPTALLVSQALGIPHATFGTGYCIPPDESPTRFLRTGVAADPALEYKASKQIVANLNSVLPRNQYVVRPTEVYGRVTETFLTTFAELDHFGARQEAHYWGIPHIALGAKPEWPAGDGPKLFAHLHADSSLPGILHMLEKLQLPSLIYVSGKINQSDVAQLSAFARVVTDPVDLTWVADQTSIAILNGLHGATAAFLLAGKPILQLPMRIEDYLVAKRSTEFGASLIVNPFKPDDIPHAIGRLLSEPNFAIRADQFRDQYRTWNPQTQAHLIVKRIEEILNNNE